MKSSAVWKPTVPQAMAQNLTIALNTAVSMLILALLGLKELAGGGLGIALANIAVCNVHHLNLRTVPIPLGLALMALAKLPPLLVKMGHDPSVAGIAQTYCAWALPDLLAHYILRANTALPVPALLFWALLQAVFMPVLAFPARLGVRGVAIASFLAHLGAVLASFGATKLVPRNRERANTNGRRAVELAGPRRRARLSENSAQEDENEEGAEAAAEADADNKASQATARTTSEPEAEDVETMAAGAHGNSWEAATVGAAETTEPGPSSNGPDPEPNSSSEINETNSAMAAEPAAVIRFLEFLVYAILVLLAGLLSSPVQSVAGTAMQIHIMWLLGELASAVTVALNSFCLKRMYPLQHLQVQQSNVPNLENRMLTWCLGLFAGLVLVLVLLCIEFIVAFWLWKSLIEALPWVDEIFFPATARALLVTAVWTLSSGVEAGASAVLCSRTSVWASAMWIRPATMILITLPISVLSALWLRCGVFGLSLGLAAAQLSCSVSLNVIILTIEAAAATAATDPSYIHSSVFEVASNVEESRDIHSGCDHNDHIDIP